MPGSTHPPVDPSPVLCRVLGGGPPPSATGLPDSRRKLTPEQEQEQEQEQEILQLVAALLHPVRSR
jgi:hypothetical protein